MSADLVLGRLEGIRRTGEGRWSARCPAHDDRSPSLAIRETGDGTLLLHCFTGCPTEAVVRALGLTLGDLFPSRPSGHRAPRERAPFSPAEVLRALLVEIEVVLIAAERVHRGLKLEADDHHRLGQAVERVRSARVFAGGLR